MLVEADGKTVDMSKAFQLFGLRGAQAAAILVKSYLTGDFKSMLDKVYEVGTAEAMAAKQVEGLGVSLKNLADRAKLIAVALRESGVSGVLKIFIDLLAKVATGIEWLAKSIGGQIIVQFAAWTAGVWLLTKALYALVGVGLAGWIKSLVIDLPKIRFGFALFAAEIGRFGTVWLGLTTFMRTHPFFVIATAVGALTAIFSTLLGATDRAQKKARELTVEQLRAKDSLIVYIAAFENLNKRRKEGEDVDKEYSATLQRMAKDHKDVANLVDINVDSHEKLIDAMKQMADEAERMALKGYAIDLRETIIQLDSLTARIKLAATTFGEYMLPVLTDQTQLENLQKALEGDAKALDELSKKYPELAAKLTVFRGTTQNVVSHLMTFITTGEKTRAEVDKLIEAFRGITFQGRDLAGMIRTDLDAALVAYAARQIEVTKAIEKTLLEKIPAQYRAMYEKLDALQKGHFLATLLQIEKRADAEIERLEKQTKDVRILEAMREEIRIEGMKKFFDAQQKEGELSKEQYIQFLNDEKAALGRWVTEAKQELKKRYGAERELLTKRTKDEEVELEKSIALIKDYVEKRARIDAAYIGKLVALESLLTKARQEEIDKRMQARYEEIQRDIAAGGSRIKKLQQEEEELLKTYKWTEEQKTTIAYYYGTKRAAILAEVFDKEKQLEIESLRIQDRKIEAYDKEIEYLKQRKEGLEARLAFDIGLDPIVAREMANQINEIENKILDATRRRAEEQKRIDVEILNERLFNIQKYSDEYTRLMEGAAAAGLVTTKELQRYYDDLIKYRAENEEKAWRLGEISAEQYFSTIEALKRRALITDEEYYSKQAILQKGWLDNLLEGVKKAKIAVEKWNETMQKIGEQIADQFATNLTSGLLDFVEGTKTAAQAFEDFARSTLRWLAEIIGKQTILNLLLKGFGGTNPLMEAMRGIVGMVHGGGIIGKTPLPTKVVNPMSFINAPKFGTGGIARNEIPAILHKGEGVFTEEQMKAMGGSGKPPSVNINIENNTGAGLKAKQKEVRWNGQEWVVNVWLDAYTRNAFGLRDSVGV
ncbi:MAG: hypothetical protein ABIB71_09265 [Candidatus Woesearchaeota archaeon]